MQATLLVPDLHVHDDNAVDTLNGSSGEDWFIFNVTGANKDVVLDLKKFETGSLI